MDKTKLLLLLRILLGGLCLVTLLALAVLLHPAYRSGTLWTTVRWGVAAAVGLLVLAAECLLFLVSLTDRGQRLRDFLVDIDVRLSCLGHWNLVLVGAANLVYAWLIIGRYGRYFLNINLRLAVFAGLMLVSVVLVKAWCVRFNPGRGWLEVILATLLLCTFAYRILAFIPDVSTYPFALNWSETSRYYYASLFFSQTIYGVAANPTTLHPSRYLMQALPFLIPDAPLWLHRFWQVVLWIVVTFLASCGLARRLHIQDGLRRWMILAWTFLFFLMGPVYYHLLVPVILVTWLGALAPHTRRGQFVSLLVVAAASLWAGISRVNWFPVPGMLAATLYFLEQPVKNRPDGSRWDWLFYLLQPALWVLLGTLLAFGAQSAYIAWSGNALEEFTSSFTSDLLWYRLWPNPTYPEGILPSILLVTVPLFLVVWLGMRSRWVGRMRQTCHPIRILAVTGILVALFAGGLVVSVKIGGGSNLHNLDAYYTTLIVVALFALAGRMTPEQVCVVLQPAALAPNQIPVAGLRWRSVLLWAGVLVSILFPVYYGLTEGRPIYLYDEELAQQTLKRLGRIARNTAAQGGRVLFISERHLLTFHSIEGVALEPDYERVFLMEMAMSGNQPYLQRFQDDLARHKFALIVTEPIFIQYKGSSESFGEENDAWVAGVTRHIFCNYRPRKSFKNMGIKLYIPRPTFKTCP